METTTGRRWMGTTRMLAVLAVIVLLAVACGGGDDAGDFDSASTGDGEATDGLGGDGSDDGFTDDGSFAEAGGEDPEVNVAGEPVDAERSRAGQVGDEAEGPGGDGGNAITVGTGTPADFGRSIIYVATVDLEVEEVARASAQARAVVAGLGGLVYGEATEVVDGVRRTMLEFRVLPEDFHDALARLEGIGEVMAQHVTADDVTERVVDLRSRIATAEVSVDRLRELLAGAANLDDVARLEQQLLERETGLEMLRGQLRTLEDQVALATIVLTLSQPAPPVPEPALEYAVAFAEIGDDDEDCTVTFDELEVDEGQEFAICVTVTNVGSTPIGGVEVRDNGLGLGPRDFELLDGAGELVLARGELVVARGATTAPAHGASSVVVSGVALNEDGEALRVPVATERTDDASIRFVEDTDPPTFGSALGASWNALVTLGLVVLMMLGALLPFVWLPVLLWIAVRHWRSRRSVPPIAPPPAPMGN